jgi:tRNA threonylcarbamoyladenosine biosynthesis protein TsaB
MLILAADTAHGKASICIYDSSKKIFLHYNILEEYSVQAERLIDMICEALEKLSISYDDIDLYSACIGPGSFTGIRIGMAALKGLAFAKNKAFIGITSLEAMRELSEVSNVTAIIKAGRGQVYIQNFHETNLNNTAEAIDIVDLKNFNLNDKIITNCIDDVKNYIDENLLISKTDLIYDARQVAILATKISEKDFEVRKSPVYIRLPDAKESSIKRKVIFKI